MPNETMDSIQNIIYFDGECGLCNKFVDFLISKDKKNILFFSPLQGLTASKSSLFVQNEQTVILQTGTRYLKKSSAAIEAISLLGGGWKLTKVFLLFPRVFRDWIYDVIARNRFSLFGKTSCRIPKPSEKHKFLP